METLNDMAVGKSKPQTLSFQIGQASVFGHCQLKTPSLRSRQTRAISNTHRIAEPIWSSIPTELLLAELSKRDAKPQCGSGERGTYNMGLHVFALFLVLVLSTGCTYA